MAAALVAHKQQTGYPYRIEYDQPGAFDPSANHYLPDHVHPSNLGHQVYGDTVQAALEDWLSITPPATPEAHPVPDLLGGYDMISARIIDHTHPDVTHGEGWNVQQLGIGGGGRTDAFLVTEAAATASDITLRFSGPELGVYYRRMTAGGQIDWNVDEGTHTGNFSFWHETLNSFTSQAMLSTGLGEGNHEAVIVPNAFNNHQTLSIAGWLVMDIQPPPLINDLDWAETVYAHLEGGAGHSVAVTPMPDGIRESVRVRSPYPLTQLPVQFLAVEVSTP